MANAENVVVLVKEKVYASEKQNTIEQVNDTTSIISRLIKNLVTNSHETKWRTISLTNKVIKVKIVDIPGAMEILYAIGFEKINEEQAVLPESVPVTDIMPVVNLLDSLNTSRRHRYIVREQKLDKQKKLEIQKKLQQDQIETSRRVIKDSVCFSALFFFSMIFYFFYFFIFFFINSPAQYPSIDYQNIFK